MLRIRRGGPQRLPALVMSVLLVASLFAPMLARPALAQTISTDPMVQLLTHYNLVRGDSQGLRLQDPLTRAELAVLVVRALGREADAQLLQGLQVFSDVPGTHWASGAVALVKRLGYVQGYPDGTFGPKRNVTYAEMLTIDLRLVNREPTTGTWPNNVLVRALELNIHPPGVVLGQVSNSPSVRLHVFQSLGATMSTVPVTPDGKTLLQANVDSTPPQVSLGALPQVTPNKSVTVQGTLDDAVRVTLDGANVPVVSGGFSTTVNLDPGVNEILVEAFDRAGNKATATVRVTRSVEVTRIDVTGPAEVNAGATATYTVKAIDRSGVNLGGAGVTARVEGGIGTFTLDENGQGTFKAGTAGAAGRIILTAGTISKVVDVKVLGPAAAAARVRVVAPNSQNFIAMDKSVTVQVEVVDLAGNRVTADNNRSITLGYSGLAGVTVSPGSATTKDGVAAFSIKGTVAGTVTLKPLATGLATSEYDLMVASPVRVKLVASTNQLNPDGFSLADITAQLVDASGHTVNNASNSDIVLKLSHSGSDGRLLDTQLVIRRGAYESYSSAAFEAGDTDNRTAVISAQTTSGHPYTVESVSIAIKEITLSQARQLKAFVVSSTKPDVDDESTIFVQVLDANGNLVTDGSVAFQLEISTSNNEDKTAGIPEGVIAYLGDAPGLVPVSDGISESSSSDGDDIIARTVGGRARITLSYDKSGIVTVKPIAVSATSSAYDDTGDEGSGSSSTGLTPVEGTLWYQGAATSIQLTVDSALGDDQTVGSIKNSTSSTFTLRARVLDDQGYPIPALSTKVRFERLGGDDVTNYNSPILRTTSDGVAEITLRATTDVGMDTFQALSGSALVLDPSDPVDVWVVDTRPDTPEITGMFGADDNGTPITEDYVAVDDSYMRIDLAPIAGAGAAAVRVFRKGSSTAIYTSPAIDLGSGAYVLVPKSKVPNGTYQYQVSAKNGAGESAKSDYSSPVTSAAVLTGTYITKAQYNASNDRLTVTGRGFLSSGEFDAGLMTLRKGSDTINLAGADADYASSSVFYVTLTAAQAADLETTGDWNGSVVLDADPGWYTRGDAGDAAPEDTGNPVTPMAHVDEAYFQRVTSTTWRIYLKGAGMSCSNTSCLDASKLSLEDPGEGSPLSLSGASVSKVSESEWYLTLSSSQRTAFADFGGPATVVVAADGWFKDSTNLNAAFAPDVPLNVKLYVNGASYDRSDNLLTITGTNFGTAADLDLSKIIIKDKSKYSRTLSDATAEITEVTATIIKITITDAGLAADLDAMGGSDVFLIPADGWFADDMGRTVIGFAEGERQVTVKY